MVIPVFWTSASSDPTWNFKIWLDQFMLAVTVKENVNPEIILEEPKEVVDEPLPRPETPGETETAQAVTDREQRNRLRRDKLIQENQERRERGPKVGHNVFYIEVQKRLTSRLILALGPEGKQFVQKNPHAEVSKLELREMVAKAKASFEKTRNITYERYRLFNRAQEPGETLELFHAALTAQAATAELGGLEEELVRDLFISRMKNTALQDTLTFETFTPDEVLKRAIKIEQSKQTTQAFQKSGSGSSGVGQLRDPQIKIKQEPIMAVGNRNSNYKRQNKNQTQKRWTENKSTNSRSDQKTCTRCGKFFGSGHLKNCPAMGNNCKSCNKPNHFAKMCRSNQVNEIGEEKSSSEEECNLIQSFDSCDEFEIMMVDTKAKEPGEKETTANQFRKKSGKETNQEITKIDIRRDPRSHKIKALKALVRIQNQIINMTIDTGSPVSFLNWTTAKQLLDGSSKIKFIPAEKMNLTMHFVDYNKHPIQILGAVCANIRSAGWEVKDAYFLVTERRAKCILGLDLQGKLEIHISENSAPVNRSRFDVLLCEQSEGNEKTIFYKKNFIPFRSTGRVKTSCSQHEIQIPVMSDTGKR